MPASRKIVRSQRLRRTRDRSGRSRRAFPDFCAVWSLKPPCWKKSRLSQRWKRCATQIESNIEFFRSLLGRESLKHHLIEEVLSPLIVGAAHQAHDVTTGVQVESMWFAHQLHRCFSRQLVALRSIARMTAGD